MHRRTAQSTFYRNRLSNFLVSAMTGLTALYFLSSALGGSGKPVAIGADAVLMVAFIVPAARFPRHGVVTSPTGIVVRNILRTYVLRWDEVERFELASDRFPSGGVAVVNDGRRIPMTGINQGLVGHFVTETVAALNEQLRRERHRLAPGPAHRRSWRGSSGWCVVVSARHRKRGGANSEVLSRAPCSGAVVCPGMFTELGRND